MPELPEVEITRRSFAQSIQGSQITAVRVGAQLRWPLGIDPQQLCGRGILGVARRGKYLILNLSSPSGPLEAAGVILIHLGMSGRLRFGQSLGEPSAHDHFDLCTDRGVLALHDPRRFGAVVWSPSLECDPAAKLLSRLGVEPLGETFEAGSFYDSLQRHSASIKQVLLGGRVVVGVGNIYASEALFAARIHPGRSANSLSRASVARLHQAIRQVLERAIELGGSTLRDFANAQGREGHFQLEAAVYGRGGEPCVRCGAAIALLKQGQRSSYFCPRCQRS